MSRHSPLGLYDINCLNPHCSEATHPHGAEVHPGDIVDLLRLGGRGVVVERNPTEDGWWFVRLFQDPAWGASPYLGYHQTQLRVVDCVRIHHTQIAFTGARFVQTATHAVPCSCGRRHDSLGRCL